jgi:hypothetical protein
MELEEMAGKLVRALGKNPDISPEDKRPVLEMLNIKVLISPDKEIKIEGWFAPPTDDGLLSTSRSWRCHLSLFCQSARLPGDPGNYAYHHRGGCFIPCIIMEDEVVLPPINFKRRHDQIHHPSR